MSILVVQIPARSRLRARDQIARANEVPSAATEYDYVLSNDDLALTTQGRAPATLLPKAVSVVAVLADTDVSWHSITLPKAPAQRLRAALSGVLEEALLDEDVHLAVAPKASAGQPTWVAAVDQPWLKSQLDALEKARVFVDRVVPVSWPDDPPLGHFSLDPDSADDSAAGAAALVLTWAHLDGVTSLRLQGGLARSLMPDPLPPNARWSAAPNAAEPAGAWLGMPVAVMTPAQRSLQAVRTTWNLRQFELAPRHRGMRALNEIWRRALGPNWRPVRIGVVALLLLQVLGLNLWAWHQRSVIASRQLAMADLLRGAYPQVRAVLDAPVQMQRETDALRAAAGRAGDNDLEPMLRAAASAWPANRPAVESLRYEPGQLTLAATGWGNEEIDQFRSRLQPAGWRVETADGRVTLRRENGAAPSPGGS